MQVLFLAQFYHTRILISSGAAVASVTSIVSKMFGVSLPGSAVPYGYLAKKGLCQRFLVPCRATMLSCTSPVCCAHAYAARHGTSLCLNPCTYCKVTPKADQVLSLVVRPWRMPTWTPRADAGHHCMRGKSTCRSPCVPWGNGSIALLW